MAHTHLVGKAGEYRVASELMLRDYYVYMPSVDNGADIMLGNGKRVQVKTAHISKVTVKGCVHRCYKFPFHACNSSLKKAKYGDAYQIEAHKLENADVVILWGINDNEFYIVPVEKIRGQKGVQITADDDRRTVARWNKWLPYRNNWGILNGDTVESNKPESELECKQCGYKWLPITSNPTRCPQCNGHWYRKMYDHTCKRCGHIWHSRIEHPRACTKCQSRVWNKEKIPNTREPFTCVQCGYTWQPEVDKPARCPKCHRQRYLEIYYKNCNQCGYKWLSSMDTSSQCPKCHSRKWSKEAKEVFTRQCKQCGYEWVSNVIKPQSCARCHSRKWAKEKEVLYPKACKQCGHEWSSSVSPVACPHCHSIKWNRELVLV